MNGKKLSIFIKLSDYFRGQPESFRNEFRKRKISIEDIAQACISKHHPKLSSEQIAFFRKVGGFHG